MLAATPQPERSHTTSGLTGQTMSGAFLPFHRDTPLEVGLGGKPRGNSKIRTGLPPGMAPPNPKLSTMAFTVRYADGRHGRNNAWTRGNAAVPGSLGDASDGLFKVLAGGTLLPHDGFPFTCAKMLNPFRWCGVSVVNGGEMVGYEGRDCAMPRLAAGWEPRSRQRPCARPPSPFRASSETSQDALCCRARPNALCRTCARRSRGSTCSRPRPVASLMSREPFSNVDPRPV